MGRNDSVDNIPNLGFEGIDAAVSEKVKAVMGEGAKRGALDHESIGHRLRSNLSTNIRSSITRSDSDIQKTGFQERLPSTDNESNPYQGSDFGSVNDDDEEEEDWDREIEERDEFSRPSVRPTIKQKFLAPNITRLSSTIQEKGSLLEFLETSLREKLSLELLPADKQGDNRKNAYPDEWNLFHDDDEVDAMGVTNQHLRGLTEWINSTSLLLKGYLCAENSNSQLNARTLMESEVQVFNSDVYFIEQVLERCEQEPTKESCIYSMEVIVKWIRGVCHQKIYEADKNSSTPKGRLNGNEHNRISITWERLGQLFARCDYILNEQSKYTVAQILELVSHLRDELNTISIGVTDRRRSLHVNRGHVVRDVIHYLCNQICLSRIHVYMLEIKAHSNYYEGNMALHLESLEVIWDELEAIKSWLSTVNLFLPVSKINFKTASTDSASVTRDPALNLQSHPKFEEAMRLAIQEEIRIAILSNSTTSIHYHRFNHSHGVILNKMLIELQACCLANKFLLLSENSSVTMQKRELTRSAGLRPSVAGRKEAHSKYNVVYEINIGSQFIDLMVKLESPCIVRSKLAFSACCYLHSLLRDALPWQSGKYNRIVLKKRNAEGFNILKKDSELGFGVDGDDIDYYIEDYSTSELERIIIGAFSSALGPVDESKNIQSLLYEAAFDLFPHLKDSYSDELKRGESSSRPSKKRSRKKHQHDYLFGHITPSTDINLSIHERIKEKSSAGSPPKSPKKSSRQYAKLGKSISGEANGSGKDRSVLVNKKIQEFIPTRNKNRHLTYLMKYELFLFSFSLLSQFVASIYDTAPNLALELYELVTRIAVHLDKRQDQLILQKKAFLLAIKLGRTEAALLHGRFLFETLVAVHQQHSNPETTDSSALTDSYVNLNEFIFVVELLIDQYSLNAQYELAVKVCVQSLKIIVSELQLLKAEKRIDYEMGINSILLKMGQSFLFLGDESKAISVFTEALRKVQEAAVTVNSLEVTISFLSWLLKCYYSLHDSESVELLAKHIKTLRCGHISHFVNRYAGGSVEDLENSRVPVHSFKISKILEGKNKRRPESDLSGSGYVNAKDTARDSTIPESIRLVSSRFSNTLLNHSLAKRFLLNPVFSTLPRFCVTDQSFDLGLILSKVNYRAGNFQNSLCHLFPVILGVEILVGGKAGPITGILELASLYMLRGRIQLDACRNPNFQSKNDLKFPFEIGSPQVNSTMHLLSSSAIPMTGKGMYQKRYFHSPHSFSGRERTEKTTSTSGAFKMSHNSLLSGASKSRTIVYNNLADVLWDAMKWFRRAFDLFYHAGDQINAARSANFIAECNLLPTFVPHLFFNIPLNVAIDLSLYQAEQQSNTMRNGQLPQSPPSPPNLSSLDGTGKFSFQGSASLNSKPPLPGLKAALSGATVVKRFVSLEEVEKVSLFALEKFLEAYVCPLELIQSYLHLAEMMLITNNIQDSLHFWWEGKDLFLHLFVDGCSIPLLRVCSLDFAEKMLIILNRIVRFLWKWDRNIRNTHLNLLEIQNYAVMDSRRVNQRNKRKLHVLREKIQLEQFLGLLTEGKHPWFRESVQFSSRSNPSSMQISTSTSSKKDKFFKRVRRSFRSMVRRPQSSNLRGDQISARTDNQSSRQEDAFTPATFYTRTCVFLENLIEILFLKEILEESDRVFCVNYMNRIVVDRIMDFGWTEFTDYNLTLVNNASLGFFLNSTVSRDSTCTDPAFLKIAGTRSTDTNTISLLSPKRASVQNSVMGMQNTENKISRSTSQLKENNSTAEIILKIIRNAYISGKRVPKYLRPFILTWGDVISIEMNTEDVDDPLSTQLMNAGHFSKFISTKENGPAGNTGRNVGMDENEQNEQIPEDPLVTLLLNEKPLDPFFDFDWMDESYCLDYTSKLFPADIKPQHFLGNFPELLEKVSAGASVPASNGLSTYFNAESLKEVEELGEKILISRIWHLFQKNNNLVANSSLCSSLSTNVIGKLMRSSLSRVSQNMLRLKSFTRQYKGSLLSFDNLHSVLQKNIGLQNDLPDTQELLEIQRFTNLQCRLPKLIYLQNVDNLLLGYHPFSGREHIQMIGMENSSHVMNGNSFYHSRSLASSASHSQSNLDLASKIGLNSIHNASAVTLKATSLAPSMGNGNEKPVEGIATCDSFSSAPSDYQFPALQFSSQSLSFLFDLYTQSENSQCGGGTMQRSKLLHSLRENEVNNVVDFIRLCSDYELKFRIPVEPVADTGGLDFNYAKRSIAVSNNNVIMKEGFSTSTLESFSADSRGNARLVLGLEEKDLRNMSFEDDKEESFVGVSAKDGHPNPSFPITLICGQICQIIPWEGILNDCSIIRNIGLLPLLSQFFEPKHFHQHLPNLPTNISFPLTFSRSNDPYHPATSPAYHTSGSSKKDGAKQTTRNFLLGDDPSAYNSYASSCSSPSLPSSFPRQTESHIRGCLGPDMVSLEFTFFLFLILFFLFFISPSRHFI
jgi:hypothetical protein